MTQCFHQCSSLCNLLMLKLNRFIRLRTYGHMLLTRFLLQVFDNTPAALDGTLAAGDEITGVNGKPVKGKTKVEVAKMIQAVQVHYCCRTTLYIRRHNTIYHLLEPRVHTLCYGCSSVRSAQRKCSLTCIE